LDHFMENLLQYTDKIVRIGEQCQSRAVLPFSLREKVCRNLIKTSRKSENINFIKSHLDRIDSIRQEIQYYDKRYDLSYLFLHNSVTFFFFVPHKKEVFQTNNHYFITFLQFYSIYLFIFCFL